MKNGWLKIEMGVFFIKKFCKQDVSVFKKKMQRNILSKKKIAKRWMRDYFISKRILNWDVLKINITFVGGQKLVPVDLHGLQLTSLAQSISN